MLTGVRTTGPRLHPPWFLAAFLSIFYTCQPTSSMPVSNACRLKTSITPNKLSCKDMSNLEYKGLILARSADTLTWWYCQDNCVISQRWSRDLMLCTVILGNPWKLSEQLWDSSLLFRSHWNVFSMIWKSLEGVCGERVLPDISYIGMYHPKGWGFCAVLVWKWP